MKNANAKNTQKNKKKYCREGRSIDHYGQTIKEENRGFAQYARGTRCQPVALAQGQIDHCGTLEDQISYQKKVN